MRVAIAHFNNLFGAPFDIMVGQFQTSDPLMKRELRLTFEDYEIYKTRVGLSRNNLAYDRGVMMTFDVEKTGTGLVGMIVNGNGKDVPEDHHTFENDKYKNYGLRLNQNVFHSLRVGYFFYYGQEKGYEDVEDAEPPVEPGVFKNRLTTHGPDITLGNGMFDLNFQYLWRKDTNPTFVEVDTNVETGGIVAERSGVVREAGQVEERERARDTHGIRLRVREASPADARLIRRCRSRHRHGPRCRYQGRRDRFGGHAAGGQG